MPRVSSGHSSQPTRSSSADTPGQLIHANADCLEAEFGHGPAPVPIPLDPSRSEECFVIAPDLPGFGASPPVDRPSFEYFADIVGGLPSGPFGLPAASPFSAEVS
jgi:pimeloyl-ACP methyl ester carboxylesterase